MVEHGGLAVEDDGVGKEALVAEVGSGFGEVVEELADSVEVVGGGEFGDGDGEGDAVEVGVWGEGGGAADFEDAFGVFLGFEESYGGSGFLDGGEGFGGVWGEDAGGGVVAETRENRHCWLQPESGRGSY